MTSIPICCHPSAHSPYVARLTSTLSVDTYAMNMQSSIGQAANVGALNYNAFPAANVKENIKIATNCILADCENVNLKLKAVIVIFT